MNAGMGKKGLVKMLQTTVETLQATREDLAKVKGAVTKFQQDVLGELHRMMTFLGAYKQALLEVDERLRACEEASGIESPPRWDEAPAPVAEKSAAEELADEVKEEVGQTLDAGGTP